MSSDGPEPVERDSRGILDPWLLRERVALTRYPAGPALSALLDRFWAVHWDLPDGLAHTQQVLTHPGANISVGHPSAHAGDTKPGPVEARLNGVDRGLSSRVLVGRGWGVAALTRPGGLGALVAGSAADYTDKVVPLGRAVGVDEAGLVRQIAAEPEEAARVAMLREALEQAVSLRRVGPASRVAEAARVAEVSRDVRRLADLCALTGSAPRTLQRAFLRYAGVSPTWVIRRYRLLDAAEAVRAGQAVSWAVVAADLGYADQAHLTRDFRAATGQTPAAYARAQARR
jgi:AraC-like DNA-binding protein